MKLISLNLWGGRIYNDLIAFLKRNSDDTDVFCFQEMIDFSSGKIPQRVLDIKKHRTGMDDVLDLYSKLGGILNSFKSTLSDPCSSGGERLAIFYKNTLEFKKYNITKVSKNVRIRFENYDYDLTSFVQSAEVNGYSINNIHGLWQFGKDDTPERIEQSKNVIEALSKTGAKRVLVGDFNLSPDTKSIKMLEDSGMVNLIKEYNIKTTRSKLYDRKEKFADYIFVSEKIKVKDFKVLDDVVSDHLPLYLDFS